MRITSNVMVDNMMRDLHSNIKRLDKYNHQLASGKKFDRPSQDPIGTATSMNFKNVIANTDQYLKNIGQAEDWLNNSETLLNDQGDVLQKARELTIYASNDTLSTSDREAIQKEMTELREEMKSIANSQMGGRYLFAGQMTKNPGGDEPFIEGIDGEIEFTGDNKDITREVGPGIKMTVNIDGEEAFKETIDTLKAVEQLLDEDIDSISVGSVNLNSLNEAIGNLDTLVDDNLQNRSEIGAKINRLELSQNRLEDQKLNGRKMLSENEDVDIADAITELKMQESIYRASLAVGARIIQPTLVDFIR